ncbi:MAG TPA: DUF4129 domain-containing protein [Pyrinomonadaceae bacterium]|nr:DUF4129 domain-containing protein [Pyrinomonadaceae bacterium]
MTLVILSASAALAIPASEYHAHMRQAVKALGTLAQSDKNESAETYFSRDRETTRSVRDLMPPAQAVEWNGQNFNVDNSWLHQDLDKYAADATLARYDLLRRITERLQALDERLTELEQPTTGALRSKSQESRKLAEILQRPEYAHQVKQQSAFSRLLEQFIQWIKSWFPKPKPMSFGRADWVRWFAQWFVIILALGVLAFVLKLFVPRLLRGRRPKRKSKAKARIVLGERLEPDQSALDLLTEAEALARRGELRAAIRRAYIALLVELGDRKIISLAQYKTNRDYLRAVRKIEPLYGNVKQLTDSFERHWYGLAQATESDWLAFRSAYKQALR